MSEKGTDPPANQNVPQSRSRPSSAPIDVRNHMRSREAVKALLDRHKKVFVCRRTFSKYGMEARILLDGKYYDVNARQLADIQAGARPEDLWGVDEIDPADDEDDED